MLSEKRRSIFTAIAALVVLSFSIASASHFPNPTLDLHEYGFPTGSEEVVSGIFYLNNNQVAMFFDRRLPGESPHDRTLKLVVFDVKGGHATAQAVVHADPKAVDITAGPDGVLFGREGELGFYDSNLQLLRSIPLARGTTGIKFDRRLNQIVIMTADEKLGQRTAHFKDGNSLEESAALSYPMKSQAVFGKDELVYAVSGNCKGAAHVINARVEWRGLEHLPACDPLTFIGEDALAYAVDGHLYVVDSKSEQRLGLRIPAPDTFEMPRFIGLSDDHMCLALSALRKETISSGWPYHQEIFVYDLASKRMILQHMLKKGSPHAALSPDGHQLATIEQGVLTLIPIP
jgi:hypothetical protein